MNSNETRTLWISVGAALFAIMLLYSWSNEQRTAMAKKYGSTKRVVVAAQDIDEMDSIDESKLTVIDLPVDFIQPGAISEADVAVGQVAAAPIKKNEQILQTKLLLPGAETGLSMEVSPGKRAITLPIDDMRGVSRLLRPGDRIDIIAALDYGKGVDSRREVRTILQDVVVLATGLNILNKIPRRFELDANGKTVNRINLSASTSFTSIVVEAKPEEAQQLIYILSTSPGNLFTVLRHPNDRLQAPTRSVTVEDLLAKPAIIRAPAAMPQAMTQPQQQAPAPPAQNRPPTRLPQKNGKFEEI